MHPLRINRRIEINSYSWKESTTPLASIETVLTKYKYSYQIEDNLITFERAHNLLERRNIFRGTNGLLKLTYEKNRLIIDLSVEDNPHLFTLCVLLIIILAAAFNGFFELKIILIATLFFGVTSFLAYHSITQVATTLTDQLKKEVSIPKSMPIK